MVPLRLAAGSTSAFDASISLAHFVLALLGFRLFVLGALVEDDSEAVQQFGILVVQTPAVGEVCPLHPFTQGEHANNRMSVRDTLSLDELRSLLD